jgi:hypothetical protein
MRSCPDVLSCLAESAHGGSVANSASRAGKAIPGPNTDRRYSMGDTSRTESSYCVVHPPYSKVQ